ncbi:MAG: hypothetical protein CMP61_06025 [Flavobacteriales bacterium]|nr:hypothetical protein [Flavobacteriales bacterium]|tara:strand:+ start:36490 stop:37695 length:1206 start_codon:yes stop_codon:yes gene_type:complete
MKILQICNKPPFPAVDGGAIAMNNTTQGLLQNGHKVTVLAITTPKHPVHLSDLPEQYISDTNFQSVYIDTSIRLRDAFFNLFTKKSYNIERFISVAFQQHLQKMLKETSFDVVIIESLFVAPYISTIKMLSNAKIVLRAHNVEHKIWERICKNTRNPLKRRYISLLAKRLKNYEIETFEHIDGIAAMTKVDQAVFCKLGFEKNIASIPTGYIIRPEKEAQETSVEEHSIFHIASMDWLPNLEGVQWFLNHVWKTVHKQFPPAKLYLAGREMPEDFFAINHSNIVTVGKVKSAKAFYLSKKIMIVPILSGSGMRIKIIEGMALGKVIISTTIGAEGINCTSGENIIIADSPDNFAQAILHCLKHPEYCEFIGKNARKLIENEYANAHISKKMISFFEELQTT